ncbi:ABC transporter ATP-binding protein [Cellulomonas fimi]|uniref:ABC-type quaternary amine transporter n=1 Tax=Cellulomonas fimi (strain ATCC 484 / DSM 20113 / JCM 1341 / CCUG 24087 / LMG 16345 / NBRC 15513 / NCIMB 8980 / NCTC 7547 / NRS-133) TaxID=590998 RepID=F4H6X2_CELFA|nr:ABC transporter related protein [Cellulomonas fimi ATCC 484]VEH26446.1 Sulfate/thiosulfate import ATP-binding protein CysA [Cellulomonas fimi]
MSGLEVHDVVVRYAAGRRGSTTAVDGVTLHVERGEVVALLGPSGCGKSSLLRAVAGLEPLAGGLVAFDGRSVDGLPVHRRGFGLMFQDGQLFPHRDVAGNVAYGLAGSERGPERTARVDALLELVGLAGYGPRPVTTLSGGERQRVALARALAPQPRLLLLDEPLSALDRALRERLAVDLRAALVATGTTAVLVTHDQDEAFAVADRVAVMDRGRLLQVGTPADLWQRPASRRVAAFLGYEAFVPVDAAAAAPLLRAIDGRALTGGVLALAEGAFVVVDRGAAGTVAQDQGTKGAVVAVTSRRGRSEVQVDVDGIGVVTALGPVGVRLDPGSVVALAVDPDAVAVLPLDEPPAPPT